MPASKLLPPRWFVKLFNYEYWTWWIFFLPMVPYWAYLALRNRSLTYFTTVNPCIPDGGVFGESKMDILNQINAKYLPISLLLPIGEPFEQTTQRIKTVQLGFPLIAKPDVGGRGFRVEKIDTPAELQQYLAEAIMPVILQEFVDYDLELGVMYARLPNQPQGRVTSIAQKEFLHIEGDGHSSLGQLLEQHPRARMAIEELRERLRNDWQLVIPARQNRLVQPIGNHCLGTKFLNANHLINDQLSAVFDAISLPIEGFYYGRFDLKVSNLADLYAGKNMKIMELNGATSEPGHVYDPAYRLWQAYRDVAQHMKIVANISAINIKRGVAPTPLRQLIRNSKAFFDVSGQI